MTDRSILCWAKCCKQSVEKEDDGEWMEPIQNSQSKRHTAKINDCHGHGHGHHNGSAGKMQKRASFERWHNVATSIGMQKRSSIRWQDLDDDEDEDEDEGVVSSGPWEVLMDQLNLTVLNVNDSSDDQLLMESLNNSFASERPSFPSMLSMGSLYSRDSVMRGLGHVMEESNSSSSSDSEGESNPKNDERDGLEEKNDEGRNTIARGVSMDTGPHQQERDAFEGGMHKKEGVGAKGRRKLGTVRGGLANVANGLSSEGPSLRKRMTTRMSTMSRDRPKMETAVDFSAMKDMFPLKRSTTRNDSRRCFQSGSSTLTSGSRDSGPKMKITSIAVLPDGIHFLAASRSDNVIKLYKQVPGNGDVSLDIELVKEFKGHTSRISALVTLDKKGRFLSAGCDKTVRLWDSRFDCEDDHEEEGNVPEPMVLLATFDIPDRWMHSIEVIDEGSYVRPTDDIDAAMVAAMAKKTALKGAAAVQRAATQREIIQCSGTFATASKNSKNVTLWEMTVLEKNEEDNSDANVAEIKPVHVLEHTASINTIRATGDMILTGDVMGNVLLWHNKRSSFGSIHKTWTEVCKYSSRSRKTVSTPEEVMKQSITCLSFLTDGEGGKKAKKPTKFVSGTANGTVRVWDIGTTSKQYHEVRKKDAVSAKMASEPLTGIQQLPSVRDPDTQELCLAFCLASADGHVISMALYPQGEELVMFHVYNQSDGDGDSNNDNGIHSIAVSQAGQNGTKRRPVVIVGDGNKAIRLLKPKWGSEVGR
jgi:WD40 repeat protein